MASGGGGADAKAETLRFTSVSELNRHMDVLECLSPKPTRELTLYLDGEDDKTWLSQTTVLNPLYAHLPEYLPALEKLTIVWRLRDCVAPDGAILGPLPAALEDMKSLHEVHVALWADIEERRMFRSQFKNPTKRLFLWDTSDFDDDSDPHDTDGFDGEWSDGRKTPFVELPQQVRTLRGVVETTVKVKRHD
jgi:hypothetical protein